MTTIQGCNFCSRRGSVSAVNAHLRNYITSAKLLCNAKFADNHPLSIMQAFAHRSKPDHKFTDDTSSPRLTVLLCFAEKTTTPLPNPAAIAAWGRRHFHTRTAPWWDRQVRIVTKAYLNHDCDDVFLQRLVCSIVDGAIESSLSAAEAEPPDANNVRLEPYRNPVTILNIERRGKVPVTVSRRSMHGSSNENRLLSGPNGNTMNVTGISPTNIIGLTKNDKERIREFYTPSTSGSEGDENDDDDDDDVNTFLFTPRPSTRRQAPTALFHPWAARTHANDRKRADSSARHKAPAAAVVRKRSLMPSDGEEDSDDLDSAHSTACAPLSLAQPRRAVTHVAATAVPTTTTTTGRESFDPMDIFLVLSVRGLTGRIVVIPIPFPTSLQGAVEMAVACEPEKVRKAGLDLGFEGDEEGARWAGKWDDTTWRRLGAWAVDTNGVVKVRVTVS